MPVFLAPLFLLAAAAVAVPLALHLLWRRKPRPMPFSTLRFLEEAAARSRRARRLTHLLLLALRVLLVLLLAAAFARPKLPARAGFTAGGHRTVWLVLDSSASMQARQPGGTVFTAARDWAAELLRGLRPGDQAALLLPGLPEPRAVFPPVAAHDRTGAALAQAKAGFAGTDLVRFLTETLERHPEAAGTDGLEIHVFSDFQNAAWPAKGAAAEALSRGLQTHQARLFLNRVRPAATPNAGLIQGAAAWTAGGDWEATATVRATADFTGAATAALLMDGQEQERRAVPLNPGHPSQTTLRGRPPAAAGTAVFGRLELAEDLFPLDNVWYLATPRPEGVRIRVVSNGTPEHSGALFVRAALATGAGRRGPGFTVDLQDWERFAAAAPDDVRLLLLCNPPPFAADSPPARRLAGILAAGGLVALFPGADSAWATQPPALPGLDGLRIRDWVADDARPAAPLALLPAEGAGAAALEKRTGSMLAAAPLVNPRHRLLFDSLPAGAAPAFAWPDGTPFLIEVPAGPGRLWLASLPADRNSSDWPLTPFFVILQQELARSGASRLARPLTALVGGGGAVDWPAAAGTTVDLTLRDPSGATRRLPLRRPAATDPFWLVGFDQPGIWRFSQDGTERLIAVNVDPVETDLAYVAPERLGALPGPALVATTAEPAELQDLLARTGAGRPLWPLLLAAALVAAVLESMLANGWLWRQARG